MSGTSSGIGQLGMEDQSHWFPAMSTLGAEPYAPSGRATFLRTGIQIPRTEIQQPAPINASSTSAKATGSRSSQRWSADQLTSDGEPLHRLSMRHSARPSRTEPRPRPLGCSSLHQPVLESCASSCITASPSTKVAPFNYKVQSILDVSAGDYPCIYE